MDEIDNQYYREITDFTFYRASSDLGPLQAPLDGHKQYDDTICLKPAGTAGIKGRLNASSCFRGQFVSCSFRAIDRIPLDARTDYHLAYDVSSSGYNPEHLEEKPNHFMNSVERLCQLILTYTLKLLPDAQGLLIVAGATATGKSEIARGLIYKHLVEKISRDATKRRPHLVTFEDPVDKLWADDPDKAKATGVDYTPREPGKDVKCLKDAVDASLRQTPEVLFLGETRDPEHWKELLRFGSTGHLGVTTCHAGSLTEAMGQILRAKQASTPARRSEVASRLIALIHLRSKRVWNARKTRQIRVTLPALWVRSPSSIKSVMADGLTALLPYQQESQIQELGCLGRTWFAENLVDPASEFYDEVKQTALTWDLGGI